MLILAALLIPVLLGMAALAVDIGGYASERRNLQNAADAIALAASHELPNESDVQDVADDYAAKHGYGSGDFTVVVTQQGSGNPNPSVRVVVTQQHEFAFAPILGVDSKEVSAAATVIKTSPGGSGNLVPWAVLESFIDASPSGTTLTLKYDANSVSSGNFGAIRIDGNGSSVYETTIVTGSNSVVCAEGVSGCQETSPVCNGAVCQSETGNKVGGTRDGVDWRVANTATNCDTFDESFNGPVDGKYQIEPSCNPWALGSYANERIILVPVIDALCNGSCDVTVVEFGLFFLEGYDNGKCQGSSCEIKGRFVNADVNTNSLTGIYDEDSPLQFVRMVE